MAWLNHGRVPFSQLQPERPEDLVNRASVAAVARGFPRSVILFHFFVVVVVKPAACFSGLEILKAFSTFWRYGLALGGTWRRGSTM